MPRVPLRWQMMQNDGGNGFPWSDCSYFDRNSARFLIRWVHRLIQDEALLTDLDFLFEFKHLDRFTLQSKDIGYPFVQRLFSHFESFELNYPMNMRTASRSEDQGKAPILS